VTTLDTMTPGAAEAPPPLRTSETPYAKFLVRLMRGVVALIVAGFIVGGIGIGYAFAHRNDRAPEWVDGQCMSSVNADQTCGYKPAPGTVIVESALGGTAGVLGGLVATFSIEVSVALYLAARKYRAHK